MENMHRPIWKKNGFGCLLNFYKKQFYDQEFGTDFIYPAKIFDTPTATSETKSYEIVVINKNFPSVVEYHISKSGKSILERL